VNALRSPAGKGLPGVYLGLVLHDEWGLTLGDPWTGDCEAARAAIGVTGHRSLLPCDHLRRRIRSALSSVLGDLGGPTGGTAISLLAEGADTIVAEEAVGLGLTLTVILPLPLEVYRGAFSTQALGHFDALLSAATCVVDPPEVLPAPGCYCEASRRMLELSDVLLAVWDGSAGRGIGGTADVVRMAREMGKPVQVVSTLAGETDSPDLPPESPGAALPVKRPR